VRARKAKLLSVPQRVVVSLGLLGLIWLCLRNGAIALFAQAQPFLALPFWPPSGAAMAASASQFVLPRDEQLRIAREALSRDPLSNWPFILAGQSASAAGDSEKAIALLEEAVRRNSRYAPARSQLLQLYMAEGRWAEVVDEGLALSRLQSSAHDSMMEVFLLLLTDVRGRAILATRLEDRADGSAPSWRDTLVKMSAKRPGEAELAALMANLAAGDKDRSAQPTDLTPDGYLAWVKRLPAQSVTDVRAVYDGDFRQLPGPPPYGWTLVNDSGGSAEMRRKARGNDGLLRAQASGIGRRALAGQVLVLSPGRYVLRVEAAADSSSRMAWALSCLSGATLAQVKIPEAAAPQTVEQRFVVPANCRFQGLTLAGAAADPSGRGQSETDSISIRPAL
jgi:tetratricopeptide (TPR) repeat protein